MKCRTSGSGSHISIHPPRVGWDVVSNVVPAHGVISIHPPRVGWDHTRFILFFTRPISIHPPRVGWDGKIRGPVWDTD